MYRILIIIITLLSVAVRAQTLSPTVISSTGGFSSNSSGSLSYTTGEMTMVQTFSANNNILTQGFQQPNDVTVGLLDLNTEEAGQFVLYPNPAIDNLYYGFRFPESGRVEIALFNVLGQRISGIYNGNYQNGKTVEQTNVSDLAPGLYFLTSTFTPTGSTQSHVITKKFQVIK